MTRLHHPEQDKSRWRSDIPGIESPSGIRIRRLPIHLVSDDARVIALPFVPTVVARVKSLFDRIEQLPEQEVDVALQDVRSSYGDRHRNIDAIFEEHYRTGSALIGQTAQWSGNRHLLAGAYLTMEYAVESAALFNPSIVPHPDQGGVPQGGKRFILSLRATGEGHVSSIVFRTGLIDARGQLELDPLPGVLSRSRMSPDRRYLKPVFQRKLGQMGVPIHLTETVLDKLPGEFAISQLQEAVRLSRIELQNLPSAPAAMETMLWLAHSNYHIKLSPEATLSELVIFPMSDLESRGVEDLRLVRFVDDDGSVMYYGTYTAYNGLRILPMFIQTADFNHIEVLSLNGACATNKGMALFPRRIGGHYVMCSRIDGENLFISYSDYVHFWESAQKLVMPSATWELMQVGNCGSPIETPEGWLLLTHGVGPMRSYCIGAMLLDLNDPLRVIGHLRQPLLRSVGKEREGYVPNVVYTCGAMLHDGDLYVPYALADHSVTAAVVNMDDLLNHLLDSK